MTELTELDRRMIGGNKRITIPLDSYELLSESLDLLKDLCDGINDALTKQGMTDRSRLMLARSEVSAYQDRLQGVCAAHGVRIREGRPKNSERLREGGMIRRVK